MGLAFYGVEGCEGEVSRPLIVLRDVKERWVGL